MPALFFLSVLAAAAASTPSVPCEATVYHPDLGKSFHYDLSSLNHAPGLPDLVAWPTASASALYVNLCGATTAPCGIPHTSVCSRSTNGSTVACGAYTTQQIRASDLAGVLPGKGVAVTYTGGAGCPGGATRSTTVYVSCDPGAVPGRFYEAEEPRNASCAYVLKMRSAAGCGAEVPYGRPPAAYVASALSSELLGLEFTDSGAALLAHLAEAAAPLRVASERDTVVVGAGPRVVALAKGAWSEQRVLVDGQWGETVQEVSVANGTLWYVVAGAAHAVELATGRALAKVDLGSGGSAVRGEAVDSERFAYVVQGSAGLYVADVRGQRMRYGTPCWPSVLSYDPRTRVAAVGCIDTVYAGVVDDMVATAEKWVMPSGTGGISAVEYREGAVWVADRKLGILTAPVRGGWRVVAQLGGTRVATDFALDRDF
eukprot:m51a1_g10151 hypothetical protein (429) ;mRNA; r:3464-4959